MSNIYTPEVVLNTESTEVVAQQRTLKATWSKEAAQDLRAIYNIDAEEELAKILAKEIAAEVDKVFREELARNAQQDAQFRVRKNKIMARPLDADWEVSRFD